MLSKPNGLRRHVSEMILLRAQLVVVRRKLNKAPPLSPYERLVFAISASSIPKNRLSKLAIVISPATILKFHRNLVKRKYSRLFSNRTGKKTGRPPMDKAIRKLVVEIKAENPSFGCPQIAAIIYDRTGKTIDDETVRRILMKFYTPPAGTGPSWLSFLGAQADSLWSCDLFRVESILLQSYWVLLVMDQYSRKIIGFAVNKGPVDGANLCRMFNEIASGRSTPARLSHDNDPLFRYHLWTCNMSIYGIDEVWSVPFTPTSHPFCERAIGTVRREFTDKILFWNNTDLGRKLNSYRGYFNNARIHSGIGGSRPQLKYRDIPAKNGSPSDLKWKKYCRGLFNVPEAA